MAAGNYVKNWAAEILISLLEIFSTTRLINNRQRMLLIIKQLAMWTSSNTHSNVDTGLIQHRQEPCKWSYQNATAGNNNFGIEAVE